MNYYDEEGFLIEDPNDGAPRNKPLEDNSLSEAFTTPETEVAMSAATRERPILFNGWMVRSILAGGKTQTRRLIKPQPAGEACTFDNRRAPKTPERRGYHCFKQASGTHVAIPCPYGKPSDILWVRETLQLVEVSDCPLQFAWGYAADGQPISDNAVATTTLPFADPYKCVPSIHMPRWSSRIQLEILSVRAERLQDITDADVLAEGAPKEHYLYNDCSGEGLVNWYCQLWESINGKGSWWLNPWVWVITFKRVEVNVKAADIQPNVSAPTSTTKEGLK